MYKKVILVVLLLLALFLYANPVYSASDDWKVVVRVDGTVQSQKMQQVAWDNIWQSKMLKDGDKARTLSSSRANVRLADGTVVTIGENTVVEMSQFKLTKDSRVVKLNLLTGKLRVKVAKFFGKENKFEVTTPTAVLAARGTDFFVEDTTKNEQASLIGLTLPSAAALKIMVFDGTINTAIDVGMGVAKANMAMGGMQIKLVAGQQLILTQGVPVISNIPVAAVPASVAMTAVDTGQQQGGDQGQQGQQGQQPSGGTAPDVDLTSAGFGAPPPKPGTAPNINVAAAPPPKVGTCAPGGTKPGGQTYYNPSNQDVGSLPVTVQ